MAEPELRAGAAPNGLPHGHRPVPEGLGAGHVEGRAHLPGEANDGGADTDAQPKANADTANTQCHVCMAESLSAK